MANDGEEKEVLAGSARRRVSARAGSGTFQSDVYRPQEINKFRHADLHTCVHSRTRTFSMRRTWPCEKNFSRSAEKKIST